MMQAFWDNLLVRDKAIFTILNGKWTHPFFDSLMPWVRDSKNWIPLYIVMVVLLIYKWKKDSWKWLLMAIINVTLTDQISSSFFKPFFHRLRPCADPEMVQHVRLLVAHCSGGFSFTSSHAANHFGIAMFMVMTLEPLLKKYRFIFFIWAAMIAYAQVYVGVHYPLDILGGSVIGLIVGYLNGKLFLSWQNKTFSTL